MKCYSLLEYVLSVEKDRRLRQLLHEITCRSCRFDLLLQEVLVGKQRRRPTGMQEDDRAFIKALTTNPVE